LPPRSRRYLAIIGAMNQFGFDGGALWLDIVAGNRGSRRTDRQEHRGCVEVLSGRFVGSVVLAAFSGGWLYIPARLLIAATGLGAGLAVANVVSVRYPMRLPNRAARSAVPPAGRAV